MIPFIPVKIRKLIRKQKELECIRTKFAFYTTFMSFTSRPNAYNLLSI